jgi:hypothetical protein
MARLEGAQKRPSDEEPPVKEIRRGPGAGAFLPAQFEQLGKVVPLVERLVAVQPLVALQAEERQAKRLRQGSRELRLADAGLALEEKGLRQARGEEDSRRQPDVGDVALLREPADDRLDVRDQLIQASPPRFRLPPDSGPDP